ncbi:MAG TPA: SurA N-terminal domain-containing protein, partial [Candidatus Dormibacteraeota bacterium]|nr:SurA N-terminal domain-containing protein [Candidatus Dormibacteraeota bacterium]
MKQHRWLIFPLLLFFAFSAVRVNAQTKSVVVEEIVARVNNDIITQHELQQAREALEGEVKQSCQKCTPEQLQQEIAEKDKNVLRDLIDQSLLVQRAKDTGINVDTDVIKRLDDIRQQYKLPSMEALETEVNKSGQNFEDFKTQIR